MLGSAVADLTGRVLAGRYLLQGAIGTGASGRVYAAEDTRLRRRVAVKVLHAALAEDAAFLRRFRAEAQLAASLHHRHIVTVHDWGEDEVPFMVLELLSGGSLRAMLDEGTTLTVAQAARVGRDVASALEFAHSRGVLHRDIKPANLLFDEHGIVRVADFGLARALAEASWTEPAGAVFGTARYASPEQAQGAHLDSRSDLYSLGLVLVEAITGTAPFGSDTAIGTLTARTRQPLVAPAACGALAPVIDRVGAIDPLERYPDAGTMRAAIVDAADRLPPPGPLLLAGMSDRADPHPTRAVPPRPSPLFDQDAIEVVPGPPLMAEIADEPVAEPAKRPPGRRRRFVPAVVALAVIGAVVLGVASLVRIDAGGRVAVRSYVGLPQAAATEAARADRLQPGVVTTRPAPDPAGTVIGQSPAAGGYTKNGKVTFVVSSGPPNVAVPDVVGKPWSDMEKVVADAGLLAEVKQKYDERAAKGVVLSVEPQTGAEVAPDSRVTVAVSQGRAPVAVPGVTGLGVDAATQALSGAGFKAQQGGEEFSDSVPKGLVTRSDPAKGKTIDYGSTVTIFVSKGPDLVTVPDVTGLTATTARQVLAEKGLVVGTLTNWTSDSLKVRAQSPKSGTSAARGSSVSLDFKSTDFFSCLLTGNC